MDLTFQVPIQYCYLQHLTLLLSPVTCTTGYCFCFGSTPPFFLESFLHWSPVAYWAPTDLGSSSFSIPSFCLFKTVHEVLKARILKWAQAVPLKCLLLMSRGASWGNQTRRAGGPASPRTTSRGSPARTACTTDAWDWPNSPEEAHHAGVIGPDKPWFQPCDDQGF